jgi:1,2-dihydroxy-3-keto-5-methylthiopentene dioxygenase
MTRLTIFREDGTRLAAIDDAAAIAAALAEIGVRFERWPLDDHADRIAALAADGYATIDTVAVAPDHPDRAKLRATFLAEHRHAEDEIRFFKAGSGLFTLRAAERVWAVDCTAGDMISVPAGMRHWFDMGPAPSFTAVRFFRTPEGWVGDFTGDAIADRFPRHDAAA